MKKCFCRTTNLVIIPQMSDIFGRKTDSIEVQGKKRVQLSVNFIIFENGLGSRRASLKPNHGEILHPEAS